MLIFVYKFLLYLFSPFLILFLIYRVLTGKENKESLLEKIGFTKKKRPSGTLVWFHAASVGEVRSIFPLAKDLFLMKIKIIITTGTRLSAEIIKKELPKGVIHQYSPFDIPHIVNKFLKHWNPDIGVWVESEIWPNLIVTSRKRNIPIALIQGKISESSFRKWKIVKEFAKQVLSCFDPIIVQTNTDATMFKELGIKNINGIFNLKADSSNLKINKYKYNR